MLSAEAIWRPSSTVWLGPEVGGRYTETSFEILRPWTKEVGAVWELSVGLPSDLVLAWNYNQYGTGVQHVTVTYRGKLGGSRAQKPGGVEF